TERVQDDPVRDDLRQREFRDQGVRTGLLDDLEAVLPIVAKGLLESEPREGSELPGVLLDLLPPLDLFPPRHLAEILGIPGGDADSAARARGRSGWPQTTGVRAISGLETVCERPAGKPGEGQLRGVPAQGLVRSRERFRASLGRTRELRAGRRAHRALRLR